MHMTLMDEIRSCERSRELFNKLEGCFSVRLEDFFNRAEHIHQDMLDKQELRDLVDEKRGILNHLEILERSIREKDGKKTDVKVFVTTEEFLKSNPEVMELLNKNC